MRRGPSVVIPVVVLVSTGFVLAPAGGVPVVDAPAVTVSSVVRPDGTRLISARAADPDGEVRDLQICVDEPEHRRCYSSPSAPSSASSAAMACLAGSASEFDAPHRYSTYGIFRLDAFTRTSSCGVELPNDRALAWNEDVVPPPSHEFDECSDSGQPEASDVGVTTRAVHIAAVSPQTGSFAFIREAVGGIRSAVDAVNAAGGVCGRRLELSLMDDQDSTDRGIALIRGAAETHFALVAMPGAAGLEALVESGGLDLLGIPVVGTTGITAAEYRSPWVWPVAPSPQSFARVVVRHAYQAGARRFAIVYQPESFSREILDGIQEVIADFDGAALVSARSLTPPGFDAGLRAAQMAEDCGGQCDAVVVALDPGTAISWFNANKEQGRAQGRVETSMTPYLFSRALVEACRSYCEGFLGWRGLRPPIAPGGPSEALFSADVSATGPTLDTWNGTTEAAYQGVLLLADALARAGANPTRQRLRSILDTETFDGALTHGSLSFMSSRETNPFLAPYRMTFNGESFGGWEPVDVWTAG